jgi:DNA-binding transcriptional LysR family regulator
MPMSVDLMRTFLAVYRAGSLTAAAPRLGLSQPTVTAQLRSLETQLGQQLFERLPRGVVPTAAADELAREVAVHIDALAAVAEWGLSSTHPAVRAVQLAGPAELITSRVLPSLAGLVDQGLRLRVTLGLADDLLAGLGAGRYDLVISTVRPRGRALTATPLTDEEFVLVAAPAWVARIERSRLDDDPVAALAKVPVVAYAEDLPIIRRYWRTVFGSRPGHSAVIVVPDLRGVLASVLAGAGMTVLPSYLCVRELAAGELVPLVRPEVPPINTFFLAARRGTAGLPHIAAVRERLLMQAPLW